MHLSRLFELCFITLGLCFTSLTFAAEPSAEAEAKKHFSAGVAYAEDPAGPKYEEAYREFRTAYELLPSHKILSNIALCALQLERDAEAIDAYQRFLDKATASEITSGRRKQMERDVQMLSASLVRVTLETSPEKVTLVDERFPTQGVPVINRYPGNGGHIELGIHPGTHKITVTAEGFVPQSWEFEAGPATKHSHAFQLTAIQSAESPAVEKTGTTTQSPPPKALKQGMPTLVYVGAAATVAFAATATVTGLVALSKKHELQSLNQDGLRPSEAESLRNDGKRFALFTDIGIGAAVLSAGATAYFYFSRPTRDREAPPAKASWKIEPNFGIGQANVTVSGKF